MQDAFSGQTLLGQTGAHLCLAPDAKRVRPMLVGCYAEALGVELERVVPLAVSVELIHSASLFHDDVIDAGSTRRGRATVNTQWTNSIAILSGNHVLSLAFKQLAEFPPRITQEAIRVVSEMTQAAILELQMRNSLSHTIEDWRCMVNGKTGSLFGFCGTCVAVYAGNPEASQALGKSGEHIGQVFQLADDLNDIEEDIQNQEASYPRLMGLTGHQNPKAACEKELKKQAEKAFEALGNWGATSGGQRVKTWLEQLAS